MALDGIVLGAIGKELKGSLLNKKIYKIYQVGNTELVFHFKNIKLYMSANSGGPSIFLTKASFENPKKPLLFSMVLRKHIQGGIIQDIYQYGNDRVLVIDIEARDDFSQFSKKSLIVEIMGRHSNIILLDQDQVIIDSITTVSPAMSRVRTVMPGQPYVYLEDLSKHQPLKLTYDDLYQIYKGLEGEKSIENIIFQTFTGFSKTIAREIAYRSNIDPERPYSSLDQDEIIVLARVSADLIQAINEDAYRAKSYSNMDKVIDFHVLDLTSLEGSTVENFDSANLMLESIFSQAKDRDTFQQKYNSLAKIVNKKLKKDQRKLSNQVIELNESKDRDKYKLWADILSANIHRIEPGCESIVLENFYSEDLEPIKIPLDKRYSGPENIQRYYKSYSSLKNAEKQLQKQIHETKAEIQYLSSVKSSLDIAESVIDLNTIKDELIQEGYIKRNKTAKKKSKSMETDFLHFEKSGYQILVGRNNRENSILTFKEATRDDTWFHLQGAPGSHVIIKNKGQDLDQEVIDYAAKLAAYYSSARNSGPVNIDYTERKNVKRHPAGKPGLVTYTDFKSIYVDSNLDH